MAKVKTNRVIYQDRGYWRNWRVGLALMARNRKSLFCFLIPPVLLALVITYLSVLPAAVLPVQIDYLSVKVMAFLLFSVLSVAAFRGACFVQLHDYAAYVAVPDRWNKNKVALWGRKALLSGGFMLMSLCLLAALVALFWYVGERVGALWLPALMLPLLLFVSVPWIFAELLFVHEKWPLHKAVAEGFVLGTRYWGTSFLVLFFALVAIIPLLLMATGPFVITMLAINEMMREQVGEVVAVMPVSFAIQVLYTWAIAFIMMLYLSVFPFWTMVLQFGGVMRKHEKMKKQAKGRLP